MILVAEAEILNCRNKWRRFSHGIRYLCCGNALSSSCFCSSLWVIGVYRYSVKVLKNMCIE